MRIAIQQLRKMKMPYSYEEDLDLSSDLNGLEDIDEISSCHVSGTIEEISIDKYLFRMDIISNLTILSAISLKPISLEVKANACEIYALSSEVSEDDDVWIIEGQTLDTKEAVIEAILLEKPMRTVGEDEEYISDYEETLEDDINPVFSSLKNLLK